MEIGVNDTSGNTIFHTMRIDVIDEIAPEWINVPIQVEIDYGVKDVCNINATDNIQIYSYWVNDTLRFQITSSSGVLTLVDNLFVGTYWVEIFVNDTSGNTNSCILKIIIVDLVNPEWIDLPIYLEVEFGELLEYDINATDNVQIDQYWINDTIMFKISSDGILGSNHDLDLGTFWLEIYVNDSSGNTVSSIIQIIVIDTIAPEWINLLTEIKLGYGTSLYMNLSAFDIGGIDQYWLNDSQVFEINNEGNLTNKTELELGVYWLEILINDTSNNINSIILTIIVVDLSAPTWINVQNNHTINYGDSFRYNIDAIDNCGIDEFWINDTSFFQINSYGLISNITQLQADKYWLRVFVNDTSGNMIFVDLSIQVMPELDDQSPTWIEQPQNLLFNENENILHDVNATDDKGIDQYWLNDTINFLIGNGGCIDTKIGYRKTFFDDNVCFASDRICITI